MRLTAGDRLAIHAILTEARSRQSDIEGLLLALEQGVAVGEADSMDCLARFRSVAAGRKDLLGEVMFVDRQLDEMAELLLDAASDAKAIRRFSRLKRGIPYHAKIALHKAASMTANVQGGGS